MGRVNNSLDDLEDDIKSLEIPADDMKALREEQQKHKVTKYVYIVRTRGAGPILATLIYLKYLSGCCQPQKKPLQDLCKSFKSCKSFGRQCRPFLI